MVGDSAHQTETAAARGSWRHSLRRIGHHLVTGHRALQRDFPKATLDAIEAAVRNCESRHPGELRVVVEATLDVGAVWAGVTPRQRAIELFSMLRVWDTQYNNGVMIYLMLADRAVEIVADRGVAGGRIDADEWGVVARLMEEHFRGERFREGAVAGVEAAADVLLRYPPASPDAGNELPDAPLVLG